MSREEEDDSIRSHLEAAFKGEPQEQEEQVQPEPEVEAQEAEPEEAPPEGAQDKVAAADEKKDDGPIEPPARWTKEEKEAFAELDPAVQRILATRNKGLEADYTRKMTEIAQERERYKGIEQELAGRREIWQRAGMNDAQALQSIMSYWDLAQRDPWHFVQVFANERGMDLASAFAPQQNTNAQYSGQDDEWSYGDEALSPQVAAQLNHIRQENAQLRDYVQQLGGQFSQSQQYQQQEMEQQARNTLVQFESETDANGQPLRPFLNDVREDMSYELRFGGAKDLQEAYDRAVWKRPDVRQKILETQEITRRREEERKRQEEAQRAKRAGASVSVPSTPAVPMADDDDDGDVSIRDLLKRQFAQSRVAGRV